MVSTNTAAVRLWLSLGFEVIGTVPGASRRPGGGLADLLVMFRPVSGGAAPMSGTDILPG